MAEYIERSDLEFPYMTMSMWGLNQKTCHAYNEGVKAAEDYIAAIPTADVAPVVHGKWVWDDRFHDYTCSKCHNWDLKMPNFCSNCGAKMKDGE